MTYRILDLFSGAGGAARGYADAGFEVVGVDIEPQPRYPFKFVRDDALKTLEGLANAPEWARVNFDAIHASPPCQKWSAAMHCRPGYSERYPELIAPVRDLLKVIGLPYVIENVPQAPLEGVTLCGSQFGLTADWRGEKVGLRRHRVFETPFPVPDAGPHDHSYKAVSVFGNGTNRPWFRGGGFTALAREVMSMDWTTRDELGEAIPPAYTEYVGTHLRHHLDSTSNQEAA